jgi:hypothetical protein
MIFFPQLALAIGCLLGGTQCTLLAMLDRSDLHPMRPRHIHLLAMLLYAIAFATLVRLLRIG